MKKLAALLILLVAAFGQAQAPLRVLILPFDATRSFEPYGLGLATGLQRSLNSLDGVYVPSVAEGGLFVSRAFEAGLGAVDAATEAFDAHVVVSGAVSGSGEELGVTVVFAGPRFPETAEMRLRLANEPGEALQAVVMAVVSRLQLSESAGVERIGDLADEAPEITSLGALARASSRLGSNLGEVSAAAELNPNSSWALAEQARALALAGRFDQALDVAERAVAANELDVEALVVRGVVADAAGEDGLARESFEAALELNSHHALALVGLAGLSDERATATRLLERAVAASPRQIDAVLRLAELETSHQRALQSLRRASVHLPESVALHRAFMLRAIEAGDPSGALAYLRDVASDPLSVSPALYGQATLLPDALTDDALAFVRAGRERFPESSGLQLSEAELLLRSGRSDDGIALLEDLHERYPESVEVVNALAVALAEAGQLDRARELFAAVAGESAVAQMNLGRVLLQAGQARAAIATLEPLIEQESRDVELFTLYGVALGRTGRTAEALAALDRALELDPQAGDAARARTLIEQQTRIVGDDAVAFEGEAGTAFERGLYALETDDSEEAVLAFARAYELSEHPLAAFYHGYSLHRSGRSRQALESYRVALEAYPESDTVLNNLGYAHLQLGRLDLALELLRQAAEANDENANVHVNLGLTFYGLGRYEEALAAWERALQLDPALEDDLAEIRGLAEERRGPR